ncbi:MAG: tetratricopeptide repeat protein [Leptolyngbya sp. SIO4C1]|nr:tetratricopeptide repeat protein [Leptolyngbya sp. SIO4C1]
MALNLLTFLRSTRSLAGRRGAIATATLAVSLSLSNLAAFAGDPFRTSAPHAIGDSTEAAFEAIFKEGDYAEGKAYLAAAEASETEEPMVHAMLASFAYLDGDWDELAVRADLTHEKATALIETDPLRGNLYSAVGIFLQGAHRLKTQGVARSTPAVLGMLQQVFSHLDRAERVSSNDPELNLIKGYMDLMLAVNLPFADPEQAINRLETYGSPTYLSHRGIALGYRDLGEYDKAMEAVDAAIQGAPNNPELFYLKAQLYSRQGQKAKSVEMYDKAIESIDQLPGSIARRIIWERCMTSGQFTANECVTQRDSFEPTM